VTDHASRSRAAAHQTELSEQRTTLGVQRTFLAFERTLMAWLRTSLSLISFGFTIAKFFQYLAEQRGGAIVGPFGRAWASDTVGLLMIAIGTLTMTMAVIQHRRRVAGLHVYGLTPQWNLALWVSAAITALGVFAFFALLAAW
jgi:putative membrane protein